jgi:hypothetical protein
MSLMSRMSRSVLLTATSTMRVARSVIGPSKPAARRPSDPRMLVSGVRSSCETTEMNSSFMRSTLRCSVMSRKLTTAPVT